MSSTWPIRQEVVRKTYGTGASKPCSNEFPSTCQNDRSISRKLLKIGINTAEPWASTGFAVVSMDRGCGKNLSLCTGSRTKFRVDRVSLLVPQSWPEGGASGAKKQLDGEVLGLFQKSTDPHQNYRAHKGYDNRANDPAARPEM